MVTDVTWLALSFRWDPTIIILLPVKMRDKLCVKNFIMVV